MQSKSTLSIDLCRKHGFYSIYNAKLLESFEWKSSMIWFKFLTGYSEGEDDSNCRSRELIEINEGIITISQESRVLAWITTGSNGVLRSGLGI